ncbi:hypothetical protein H9P43_002235 [Blastocladiella emersonii ATCC 22665]|nr:hypothetical protein H9P43_002235 [Blastocladiella emersonii ATCC 22665]
MANLRLLALVALVQVILAGSADATRKCHKKAGYSTAPKAVTEQPAAAYVRPEPIKLQPIPVPRVGYAPVKEVKAVYAEHVVPAKPAPGEPAAAPVVVKADCTFRTTKPAVNLANYAGQIKTVRCPSASAVIVEAATEKAAAEITKAWSAAAKDMALLMQGVPGIESCGDSLARAVVKVTQTGAKTVEIATEAESRADLIAEYDIEVSQMAAPAGETKLSKRGLWDFLKTGITGNKLAVGLNYDPKTSNVVTPRVKLAGVPQVEAACVNCYAAGEIGMLMSLKGNPFKVMNFTVGVEGSLKTNMDFEVTTPSSNGQQALVTAPLKKIAVHPISIKKIFRLEPELSLEAGVSYQIATENGAGFGVTAGFDATVPFDLTMTATGFKSKPKFAARSKPVVNPHMPKGLPSNVGADIAAHLAPRLVLRGNVLFAGEFNIDTKFDNTVGLGVTANAPQCAGRLDGTSLAIFSAHEITSSITAGGDPKPAEYKLWSKAKADIQCKFCGICLAPAAKTTAVAETATFEAAAAPTATATTTAAPSTTVAVFEPAATATRTAAAAASKAVPTLPAF